MFGYIHRWQDRPGQFATGIGRTFQSIRSVVCRRPDVQMVFNERDKIDGFEKSFCEDFAFAKFLYPRCGLLVFDMIPYYDPTMPTVKIVLDSCYHAVQTYDRIFTISNWTRDTLIQDFHVKPENVEVHYLGYSQVFKSLNLTEEEKKVSRGTFGIPEGRRVIGHCSYGYARKNLQRVFEAMKPLDDVLFVKVGRDHVTPKLAEECGVADRVIYLDALTDERLCEFYNCIDLFIFPSTFEGFGLPALEAQACGCPTITSRTTALGEIVGPGAIGVDPYSVDEIRMALRNPPQKVPVNSEWLSQFNSNNLTQAVNRYLC